VPRQNPLRPGAMRASSRDPMQRTSDINVVETRPLPSPAALLAAAPKTEAQAEFVTRSRQDIHRLIFTDDRRLLMIVGPCSIHDVDAGREYAERLAKLEVTGRKDEAEEAARELPDPVDHEQLREFGDRHGISVTELTDRMGGSP